MFLLIIKIQTRKTLEIALYGYTAQIIHCTKINLILNSSPKAQTKMPLIIEHKHLIKYQNIQEK